MVVQIRTDGDAAICHRSPRPSTETGAWDLMRISAKIQPRHDAIVSAMDAFCERYLDEEHKGLIPYLPGPEVQS